MGFELRDPTPAIAQPRGSWRVAGATELPRLREELRDEMGERRVPAQDSFALAHPVERVLLAATELVGNALRHAAPPVTLHLQRSARGWMVKVTDGEPDARPEQPEKVAGAAGKRGLLIVDAVSEGTGWCPDGVLKLVWAFVPDEPPERLVRTLRPGSYG